MCFGCPEAVLERAEMIDAPARGEPDLALARAYITQFPSDPASILLQRLVATLEAACRWVAAAPADAWETECGETFRVVPGTDFAPVQFCPYCGRRIKKPRPPQVQRVR